MTKFKPGLGFSDFVVSVSKRSKTRFSLGLPSLGVGIIRWVFAASLLALCLLWIRVLVLTVLLGERYETLANENRIKRVVIPAPRGKILDRNGQLLAYDEPAGTRHYPLGATSGHAVGYLGQLVSDEVGLLRPSGGKYDLHDLIGRMGIEQALEEKLKGHAGGKLQEVDHDGLAIREMGSISAVAGLDIKLTLNSVLQTVAYEAIKKGKAAVVASVPATGEILVMASSPGFDPANITLRAEFLNRAIGAVYAPGSTFKMVSTIAGIDSGKLDPGFTYKDAGYIKIGDFIYNNWFFSQYGRTEGIVGWAQALTRSTDTFFYETGAKTGPDTLAQYAQKFGFGELTGIEISGEVAGLVPTPAWKMKTKKEAWFVGNTYHVAIGQGDLLATPLQVNQMTNILAMGGKKCRPHLLTTTNVQCSILNINRQTLEIVKRGMIGACSSGGTAFPFFDFKPEVACKTGTAEYVLANGKIGTHAWFTVFAPVDNPTISVTVLVEGGGEGSRAAAPVARKILAKYFGVEDHFNYAAVATGGE